MENGRIFEHKADAIRDNGHIQLTDGNGNKMVALCVVSGRQEWLLTPIISEDS
jgi:hypothetical protein